MPHFDNRIIPTEYKTCNSTLIVKTNLVNLKSKCIPTSLSKCIINKNRAILVIKQISAMVALLNILV